MKERNNVFLKVWGMPILLSVVTIIGLISAIMGLGVWHFISWMALSIPVYIMIRYGLRYFK
ncbi:hypothetical protein CPT03_04850 [Pedobacter ginsengisoli]|uniref:Uncharacterized protein n=1 Tax=Pedobacter ginsengisoli TaxID=363852 RepID=A0A2D1U2M1_9SPHI|nr:hypothetical protein [Pedobacter ginsengisoli]ATP55841.1 hypothetical protein CPT03_04850 [Pedobacter ginsengisoli]